MATLGDPWETSTTRVVRDNACVWPLRAFSLVSAMFMPYLIYVYEPYVDDFR